MSPLHTLCHCFSSFPGPFPHHLLSARHKANDCDIVRSLSVGQQHTSRYQFLCYLYSLCIFCLSVLPVIERGRLRLFRRTVFLPSILPTFVCFRCFNGLPLDMQMFMIAVSSCSPESFITIKCPLSLVTFLNLQFILSDISIAIPAPFGYSLHKIYFPSFPFHPVCGPFESFKDSI